MDFEENPKWKDWVIVARAKLGKFQTFANRIMMPGSDLSTMLGSHDSSKLAVTSTHTNTASEASTATLPGVVYRNLTKPTNTKKEVVPAGQSDDLSTLTDESIKNNSVAKTKVSAEASVVNIRRVSVYNVCCKLTNVVTSCGYYII